MCVFECLEPLGRGLLCQMSLVLEQDGGGGVGMQQVLPVGPRLTKRPAPQQQVLKGSAILPTRPQPLKQLRGGGRERKKERKTEKRRERKRQKKQRRKKEGEREG